MKKKPKALVLDLDDTIVNFLETVTMIHNRENNTCICANDIVGWNFEVTNFTDARGNTVKGEELMATFKKYEPYGLYSILKISDETKFALDIMHAIKYKIIILTARKHDFEQQTKLNLIMNNIPFEDVIFDWDKVKQIKRLKKEYDIRMFADDNFDNVKSVAEHCDLPYVCMINKGHNLKEDADKYGIIRVKDLQETVRYLK